MDIEKLNEFDLLKEDVEEVRYHIQSLDSEKRGLNF